MYRKIGFQIIFFSVSILFFHYKASAQVQPYEYLYNIEYKLTYQSDSTNSASIKEEYMTLRIGKEQSIFCSQRLLIVDSAQSVEFSKGNKLGVGFDFLNKYGTRYYQTIFKNADEFIVYDKAASYVPYTYIYNEPKTVMHWDVLNDTLSIGDIMCQKAKTQFGGREWVAWFAPSIPLNDGPYKFCGLPGLILKVSDVQKYWNFEFIAMTNSKQTIIVKFLTTDKVFIKNKDEFYKKKAFYRDNSFLLRKQMGTRYSDEVLGMKLESEQAKKDNNWIELHGK